ncbi:MAG: hypothetical protein KF861_05640, partial [Planctomycetaceae bacterium]|nr:hypothetical protein [Planctomycetaceae bacterium]
MSRARPQDGDERLVPIRQRHASNLKIRSLEPRIVLNADVSFIASTLVIDNFTNPGAAPEVTVSETDFDFGNGAEAAYQFQLSDVGDWNDPGAIDLDGDPTTNDVVIDPMDSTILYVRVAGAQSDPMAGLTIDAGGMVAVTLSGDVDFQNIGLVQMTGASITQSAASTLAGTDFVLQADSISLTGFNGDDLTLKALEIDFAGVDTINGNGMTGALRIDSLGNAIRIGGAADTGAATLDFTADDVAALGTWSSITFGADDNAAAITVAADVSFTSAVVLNSDEMGGSITISGKLQTTGSTSNTITLNGTGATTVLNADMVTAGAAININDSVLVDGVRLLDTTNGGAVAAGANITITGVIDGANAGGTDTLSLRAGTAGNVDLQSAVEGGAGAQTLAAGQDLESLTVVSANNATFAAIDGAFALVVNASGATTFNGAIGGTTALTSVATDMPGTTAINGGAVNTTGNQTFADQVTIGSNTILNAGGMIRLEGGINGAFNLTLTSGTGSDVGATIGPNIVNLTVNGGALVAGTIDITGHLDANAAVTTDVGGILVDGDVDSESTLTAATTVNVGGDSELGGNVTALNGNLVLGNAVADNVTLTAHVTLAATGMVLVSGGINGAFNLVINSPGATVLGGFVGESTPLVSLTTDMGGTTEINGGGVSTTGGQTYNDNVVLGTDATLFGTNIVFNSTVDGAAVNAGQPNHYTLTIGRGTDDADRVASVLFTANVGMTSSLAPLGGLTIYAENVVFDSPTNAGITVAVFSTANAAVMIDTGTLLLDDADDYFAIQTGERSDPTARALNFLPRPPQETAATDSDDYAFYQDVVVDTVTLVGVGEGFFRGQFTVTLGTT